MNEIENFHNQFLDQVSSITEDNEDPKFHQEAFLEVFLNNLQDQGWVLEDNQISAFKTVGGEIHGFAKDIGLKKREDDFSEDRIDLFYCLPIGKPVNAERRKVIQGYDKLSLFVKDVLNDKVLNYDNPSEDEIINLIKNNYKDMNIIRFFVFTDGTSQVDDVVTRIVGGKEVQCRVIDISKLEKLKDLSIEYSSEIDIDFLDYKPPCIEFGSPDVEFKVYQSIFPGDLIANLYADHGGQRLLQLNVRSYLQNRRKVNKGISETLINSPEKFIAFNNGLTIVSNGLEVKDGILKKIKGMQIVNGGQTTVSLYNQRVINKAALKSVNVPVKIIEVNDIEENKDLFQEIALTSNSQNPIKLTDLYSLDDYFIDIEKLSRKTLAPLSKDSTVASVWFFERTAGQFKVFRSQKIGRTSSRKKIRSFDQEYPSSKKGNSFSQVVTKDQIGKSEMAWLQMPDRFAKGGVNCFDAYMKYLDGIKINNKSKKLNIDEKYFKHLISRIILLRTLEDFIAKNNEENGKKRGFHRQPILGYSISMLSKLTNKKIDFDKIWKEQIIGDDLLKLFEEIVPKVREYFVNNAEEHSSSVSEWAKTSSCWKKLSNDLDIEISNDLVFDNDEYNLEHLNNVENNTVNESELPELPENKPKIWNDLLNWGYTTKILTDKEASMISTVERYLINNKEFTRKQLSYAISIWEKSIDSGFEVDKSN